MKNHPIKLVLCDLDGTLLTNEKTVTEKTRKAIRKLKNQGIRFGIATGRAYEGIKQRIVEWGIEEEVDVLIAMNGAQIYDMKEKQLHTYFKMKKEWIKEIIERFWELDINPCFYDNQCLYCRKDNEYAQKSALNNKLQVVEVEPEKFWENDRIKLLFLVEEGKMPGIEAFNAAHPSEYYRGFKSQSFLFEFVDTRVSKSYGIDQYCKMYGFTLNETCAFGDMSNDVEMLKDCGVGVCMANGSEDAKAASDVITLSNEEDGVAYYIENYILSCEDKTNE